MSAPGLKRLIDGLALDHFKLRIAASGPQFRGSVTVRGAPVAIRLDYSDIGFTEPPKVFVEVPEALGPGVIAHLDEHNELCVVDRRVYVADRYAVAEHARGIVRRAAEVLERGLTKAGSMEIADEFPRHWGGSAVRVRFGPTDGFAKVLAGEDWLEFCSCSSPRTWGDADAVAVQTEVRLSFLGGQTRPKTLQGVLDWARSWDPALPEKIVNGLAAIGPNDPFVIIHAPNGVVAFQLMVSAKGTKTARAINQPGHWQTLLRGRFGQSLPIIRHRGQRTDMAYLLGVNGAAGKAPLAGRRIVLVGCGAIGGFLAFALAQFGAGLDDGALLLLDPEVLDPRNVGRHRLGVDKVGENKAVACKAAIDSALPGLAVTALPMKIEQCQVRALGADLVIDATGEQAIGDLLNAWRLERVAIGEPSPALLHAWVEGNGAAVQTYFSSDPAFGCYRCLQPDLAQPQRYPVLRPDADVSLATGCGEAPFSPYGPAAPMMAAALAADHAVDWAKSTPKPLLRTLRLSYEQTQERKPTNPTKSDKCPACGVH